MSQNFYNKAVQRGEIVPSLTNEKVSFIDIGIFLQKTQKLPYYEY